MEKVFLELAFFWKCPNCSASNFARGEDADMSDEDIADIVKELYDMEEWEELPEDFNRDFLLAPKEVICSSCDSEFDIEREAIGLDSDFMVDLEDIEDVDEQDNLDDEDDDFLSNL